MNEITVDRVKEPLSEQIESAVSAVPGWTPIDQLCALGQLVHTSSNLGGDILEIGSWCGRSAIAMALGLTDSPEHKVFCVDLFPDKSDWYQNEDSSYSFRVRIGSRVYESYNVQTVWEEPFEKDIRPLYDEHPELLEFFSQNIEKAQLSSKVVPFRGDLEGFLAAEIHTGKFRLVFLDGDHSFDAVANDIKKIQERILPGGWICFDDAFSYYDGVNKAIQDFVIDSDEFANCQQMTRKLFVAQKV